MGKTGKQNESKMSESAELAQALMRCTGTGIYIIQDGRFQYVNSLFQELAGYTEQELRGVYSLDLVHPEDREAVRGKAIENLRGHRLLPYEYRLMRKNGEAMWVLERLSSIEYRGKRAAVGSFMDITDRKRADQALQQSEGKYRTILAEIQEGYYEVDLAGNFTFVNNATCRQLGYSKEELIGMNYRAYVPKEEIKGMYKAWNKVYRTGKPLKSFPFTCIREDGTQIFLEASVSPLRNNEGKIIGFRSISRDVTEHKQFEQKLTEMATHDPLTGLPNRILLSDRFTIALALSRRTGNRLAVLMLDLDQFKTVNDSMGHDVGDQLLKAVGERLTGIMRKSDTVARIGGDEFVLVLPQIPQANEAAKFAQRILDGFREPFVCDDRRLSITTSIGVAICPEDGKDIESLLKNADTAMYWAKEQGRDIYKFYDGEAMNLLAKQARV
jgi:diguanylate cyclase (GGDEF)-like protein/PAS domain S-box-containing protein